MAVNVVLLPIQIEVVPVIFTTGIGVTLTVTTSVLEHPEVVPVTVYVVVEEGVAKGFGLVGLLNPVVGNHE